MHQHTQTAQHSAQLVVCFAKPTFPLDTLDRKHAHAKIINMAELGSGCYLTFSPASQGTLFINWSETPVDGALAFFRPNKTVPKFKFTTNGGRSELIRTIQGPQIKRYFQVLRLLSHDGKQRASLTVIETCCSLLLSPRSDDRPRMSCGIVLQGCACRRTWYSQAMFQHQFFNI